MIVTVNDANFIPSGSLYPPENLKGEVYVVDVALVGVDVVE